MVANRPVPTRFIVIRRALLDLLDLLGILAILAGLLSGCGLTSVFNAAAPLASDVTIPYSVGASSSTAAGLVGLKGRDGGDTWHTDTGEPSTQFAPIMVNGVIYTEGGSLQPPQGALMAIRATDGHTLWQAPMPIRDFSIATDGVTVLVAAKSQGLYALDATNGALRWHLDEPATEPLYVKDGVAIATRTDAQGQGAHLAVYQADDGKPLWQLTYVPAIGINHTMIYTSDSDEVLAYAARTGKELWHAEIAGNIFGATDQTVLLSGPQNVASLDAATGHVLWNVPVVFDGWQGIIQTPTTIYGAHQDVIIALSASGATLSSEFTGYIVVQITEVQGVVFALLSGGAESSKPARIAALNGAQGGVYWERDIQEISFLVDNVQG